MRNYELAKIAYDAYCESRSWKSVRGEPLPQFEDQSEELRLAWWQSAAAVHSRILADPAFPPLTAQDFGGVMPQPVPPVA